MKKLFAVIAVVGTLAALSLGSGPPAEAARTLLAEVPIVLPFQDPTPPPATTVEGLVSYRLKFSAVATQRIGSIHDLFGRKGLDVDIRPFLGVNLSEHNAGAGGIAFSLPKPLQLAKEVSLTGGIFLQGTINHPVDGGLYVSFTWRLGD